MKRPLDDRERREQDAYERLGTDFPQCQQCGESDPFALVGVHPDILCYQCDALAHGRSWMEGHHVAGQHNDRTKVWIPGNDHRRLNDMQRDWPRETLRNPTGSPLRRAAAALRGWLNVLRLIIERTVGWIPDALERLDAQLTRAHGNHWWEALDSLEEQS
jgi:hypothetical protein